MNISGIIFHKVFVATGMWFAPSMEPWKLVNENGVISLQDWAVPCMEQPDITAFTEADSDAAEAAWAAHVESSKSPARKAAENKFIAVCDSIKGTTHQPFGPEEARTLYDQAVAAGQFQTATPLLAQWLLAAIGLLAADIGDVSWHSDV